MHWHRHIRFFFFSVGYAIVFQPYIELNASFSMNWSGTAVVVLGLWMDLLSLSLWLRFIFICCLWVCSSNSLLSAIFEFAVHIHFCLLSLSLWLKFNLKNDSCVASAILIQYHSGLFYLNSKFIWLETVSLVALPYLNREATEWFTWLVTILVHKHFVFVFLILIRSFYLWTLFKKKNGFALHNSRSNKMTDITDHLYAQSFYFDSSCFKMCSYQTLFFRWFRPTWFISHETGRWFTLLLTILIHSYSSLSHCEYKFVVNRHCFLSSFVFHGSWHNKMKYIFYHLKAQLLGFVSPWFKFCS